MPLSTKSTGRELGYAEVTNFSGVATNTSLADVAGLTITITVGSRPIFLEAYMPFNNITTGTGRAQIVIVEGGTTIQIGATPNIAASANAGSIRVGIRLAPSAGSHTYKVQANVVTATAGSYTSGATFPAYIRAVEI